jgi:RND family efflux transporter MFP subunit
MHNQAFTVAAALLLLAGCKPPVEPPPRQAPPVTVQTPDVREVTLYEEFTGRTDAIESVEIRARVRGFLQSVEYTPGRPVKEGDLLFTIEPEPFEAAVASAKAQLESAKAALELAEVTLERATAAHAQEAVTDLELAQREAERDAAIATVRVAEAALQVAQIDLGYTKVYSPIDGRASRNFVDVGNVVGSGEPTLLTTVVLDDPIYAYFTLNERMVLEFLRETPRSERTANADENRVDVQLELVDGGRYEHLGVVDFADTRIDPMTGTLQARARFENAEGILFPGQFVRIRIPAQTGEFMIVPEVALQRDLAGPFVLVADDQDIVQRRGVELGRRIEGGRIVRSGLEPTDRVIVSGIQRAIPENPVTPTTAEPMRGSSAGPADG